MKTETQTAKSHIKKVYNETTQIQKGIMRIQVREHKASCQRFLEFLEFIKNKGRDALTNLEIEEKIIDLKQAIKLYEDAGI